MRVDLQWNEEDVKAFLISIVSGIITATLIVVLLRRRP